VSRAMDTGAAPLPAPPGGGTHPRRVSPRGLLAAGAAVLLMLVALLTLDALTPFVLGLLLIYLLAPAVDRLSGLTLGGRHLPRWLVILALYLVIAVVLGVGIMLVVGP